MTPAQTLAIAQRGVPQFPLRAIPQRDDRRRLFYVADSDQLTESQMLALFPADGDLRAFIKGAAIGDSYTMANRVVVECIHADADGLFECSECGGHGGYRHRPVPQDSRQDEDIPCAECEGTGLEDLDEALRGADVRCRTAVWYPRVGVK